MPGISQNDSLQARMRAIADRKALDSIVRNSELRGDQALHVARHAVAAATPSIRAEYAQKLAGASEREIVTAGLVLYAAVAVEAAAYITMFRRGGGKTRALAGTALAISTGMAVYGQFRQARMRLAARAEMAAAGKKSRQEAA